MVGTSLHQRSSQRLRGLGAIGMAAVLWGTIGPVLRAYPSDTNLQFVTVRNVIAVATLWAMVLMTGRTRFVRHDIKPAVLGAIGTASFLPLYAAAFARSDVAVVAVLTMGSAPIFTALFARIFLRTTPHAGWYSGTVLALVGLVLLNASSILSGRTAGIPFAIGAAVAYSIQVTGMGMLAERHSPTQSVAVIWTIATVFAAPLAMGRSFDFLTQPMLLLGVIYAGTITVAVTFSMFTYGMARVGPATAVTMSLLDPITAACLGIFVLHETPAPLGLAGMFIVLAGLAVAARSPKVSTALAIKVE